ncbi:hypothetical protein PSTG_03997 [Puccinia striiformis f. sp. tritici PST-78]|uniref:Survival protein SurE-like phosphatase/nucleotidase domain-containing protein n=1 Tax=Puccinia striiformis f. sp. tritici PST-78 TaxID=1165861 RepID=A0A0L0VTW2_9BASI|nr:hypothetical protein PSTG_03997 [Puccinia striiformis f. sp. tritici PST-78]
MIESGLRWMIVLLFSISLIDQSRSSNNNNNIPNNNNPSKSLNILQGNDDGWAECNIRTLYRILKERGHQTMISAPVRNKSGTGSMSRDWSKPLTRAGEYDSVPIGAPGVGSDPTDPNIWYVNAFPIDGIRYGLDALTPQMYKGNPDLIITGPNVGKNIGLMDRFSGTLNAAAYGNRRGVPAIAISVDDGNRHGYLSEAPDDPSEIYANVTMRVVNELLKMDEEGPYLPDGCVLNINLQKAAGPQTNHCRTAADYKFALTSIFGISKNDPGFSHCGSDSLPAEHSVLKRVDQCWASVTVIQSKKLNNAYSDQKRFLVDRSPAFFSCPGPES